MRVTTSVAMCTHNGADFLREQLVSIARQRPYPPNELIISDDDSSDDTLAIAEDFAREAPFLVHIIRNSPAIGIVKNFEQAISACSSEIIFLCDQDDIWQTAKIEVFVRHFADDPELDAVFSDLALIDAAGRPLGATMFERLNLQRGKRRFDDVAGVDELLRRCVVTGAALAVRKRLARRAQPFPADLNEMLHDRWLGLFAATTGRLLMLPEPLTAYRQHGRQIVGAPENVRLEAARSSPNAVIEEQRANRAIISRLRTVAGPNLLPLADRVFRSRMRHLAIRSKILNGGSSALALACEAARGGYHRHSNGWSSIARDLARVLRA